MVYTLEGSEDGLYEVETSAKRAARKALRYGGEEQELEMVVAVEDEDAPGGVRFEEREATESAVRRELLDEGYVLLEGDGGLDVTIRGWDR